jgi:hypothetical protein
MLRATLTTWDATACRMLNRTNRRWMGAGFRAISRLGNGSFWYALIAALPLVHGAGALRTSVTMSTVARLAPFHSGTDPAFLTRRVAIRLHSKPEIMFACARCH